MRFASLLDLGCGTGLAGAVFRPFAARLVGVDLSPAMIARAHAKGDYDRLTVGSLAAFLADEIASKTTYDLVLAAEVFVYLSEPAPVLADIARVLTPRGVVAPSRSRRMQAPALRCWLRCALPTASLICAMPLPPLN